MSQAPVLIMAGGTGGHVFPALAVARELRARSERVVWLAGVRMSEDYRVTERSADAVRLTWEPGHDHRR